MLNRLWSSVRGDGRAGARTSNTGSCETLSVSETAFLIHVLRGLFSGHELLRHRSDDDYLQLLQLFKEEVAPFDCVITSPGKLGSKMYIIKEGTVDVFVGDEWTRMLERGAVIGELSLLYGAPRSAKCVVSSQHGATLYSLSRAHFLEFIDRSCDSRERLLSQRLLAVPEMTGFVKLAKLVKIASERRFSKGSAVYTIDAPASRVLIITAGVAAVFTQGITVH